MAQNTIIYPVDTDQFEDIRESGKFYADKTKFLYDLIHVKKFRYVFLARPRRFGKSLMCNTLKAYFQGKKELFQGLAISQYETQWLSYPVLHFTFSGLKNVTVGEAKSKLESFIADYEQVYGNNPIDKSPGARFRRLIQNAFQQTSRKVVVIIDEYDSAMLRLLYHPNDREELRSIFREFFQVLKDEGAYIQFCFITGVTKFSQLSIFSELNNLMDISMVDDYSGICGITQSELMNDLRAGVEQFAHNNDYTTEHAYQLLKKQYDGYRFSKNSEEVFSPFSLLRCLQTGDLGSYWFSSATPTALLNHLAHYPNVDILALDGVEIQEQGFNTACEDAITPIPLLYQTGYLSIRSYEKEDRRFILHFPNFEVREGVIQCLIPSLLKGNINDEYATITQMARALRQGNLSEALIALRAYIARIPYDIISKADWEKQETHEAFYKMLMYIIFSLLNSNLDVEVKSVLGRADVVIQTQTEVFVLELKVNKSAEDALAQIRDKGYSIPWSANRRIVRQCGITIDSKCRNISRWLIANEQGHIIEQQSF